MGIEVPKYVRLGHTSMRLVGKDINDQDEEHKKRKQYWRDAGSWGINYKIVEGKLLADSPNPDSYAHHFDGQELIPISKEEYEEENKDYLE